MGEGAHLGIMGDQARRLRNLEAVLLDPGIIICEQCNGTGNEFYAMYRKCSKCNGFGVVDAPKE